MESLNPSQAVNESELHEAELLAWDEAWRRTEIYLGALGVRNKLVLSRKLADVMERAEEDWRRDRSLSPTALAIRAIDAQLTAWLRAALDHPELDDDEAISQRGRLALLLVDMPGQWQDAFLGPPPWPPQFIETLRRYYPSTGPEFRRSHMSPRPLDLGTLPKVADAALRGLENHPKTRFVLTWGLIAGVFISIFILSR